jgi:hypothetical protein
MDENLVGYLLKALDAEEQREVEDHLRQHPEAQKRLEQLRRRLDLLAEDGAEEEPAEGLWVRTLARVAEHKCRNLPQAPRPGANQAASGRLPWRRADVLVAACLLVVVGGLTASGLLRLRTGDEVLACQNNLREFHHALSAYSDQNEGKFPWVEAQPPRHFAGCFVPILNDAGLLPKNLSASCPSHRGRSLSIPSLAELEDLRVNQPGVFRSVVRDLAGCYAYPLGYRDTHDGHTVHLGLTRQMDGELPLLADRPPTDGAAEGPANSPNHGGRGQNVLFVGGHVRFCTARTVGLGGDDIYVNAERRVEYGHGARDSVLGPSEASPYPHLFRGDE